MTAFDELLALQDLDLRADQLRHRLGALEQKARVASIRNELAAFDAESERIRNERDELARTQKRYEDEVAIVEAKAKEIDGSLYGGSVTSPRELQALQAELESVKNRQGQIEDNVLNVMEQIDPLDKDLLARAEARVEIEKQEAVAVAALEDAEREIKLELDAVDADRAPLLATVPDNLLNQYGTLRERLGGIGVARLNHGTCGGCHLMLSAVELDRIKHEPPDALVHCGECGRLLVR